ncbi:MAG: HEAT repeat domain-containing protein, partial [Planctomycetota bacterium]|nr:HEAT repeat domain-containing protein [Planctomycetota bacterium]
MPKRPGVRMLCAASALLACLAARLPGEEAQPAPAPKLTRAERRAEIEKQLKRLKSEVFAERAEAAEKLRAFGAEALPLLTAAEPGDDADYATQLANLIRAARLGEGGQFGEAVSALLRGYASQDATARQQTINLIVRRAGARCVPLLIGLLDDEEDAEVQSLLVSKLSYLSPGADGLKPLLKFYERAPEEVKGQVLQALAAIPCDESRKAVREALENGPPSLQAWAVQSVQRLNDRACLPALRKLAAGGEEIEQDLRLEAINAITGLLDEEAGPLFRKLLEENREIQNAALYGLAGIRDRGAAPLLIQMLKDESKKDLHELIVDTMGSIGDPAFLPLLRECLHAPAPAMRISAVGALQAMDAREAAGEIDKLLDDADLDVQKYAVDAVAAFRHKESIPKLRRMLGAADEGLRHACAKALANLGEA